MYTQTMVLWCEAHGSPQSAHTHARLQLLECMVDSHMQYQGSISIYLGAVASLNICAKDVAKQQYTVYSTVAR